MTKEERVLILQILVLLKALYSKETNQENKIILADTLMKVRLLLVLDEKRFSREKLRIYAIAILRKLVDMGYEELREAILGIGILW